MLILIEEVVRDLVEHHATNRLLGEIVLRPGLAVIQRVKVKLVLVSYLHDLDDQLLSIEVDNLEDILRRLAAAMDSHRFCNNKAEDCSTAAEVHMTNCKKQTENCH